MPSKLSGKGELAEECWSWRLMAMKSLEDTSMFRKKSFFKEKLPSEDKLYRTGNVCADGEK